MTTRDEWSDVYILRVLDLGNEQEWVEAFGRLARQGFPGSQIFLEPGRVEYWITAFADRLSRSDETGRRARVLVSFVPKSPPFVHRFLRDPEIPESEKLRFVQLFVMASEIERRKMILAEAIRQAFINAMLRTEDGRHGWEICGIHDVHRLLRLLSRIVPPQRMSGGGRRRPNRQSKRRSGPASLIRIPLRRSPVQIRVDSRKGRSAPIQSWQVVLFLKFADQETQEMAFSWVADFPELLCRLAGYDLSNMWQARIQGALKNLLVTRRGEVIAALRRHQTQLRGLIHDWAEQAIQCWTSDMKLWFVPSGGNESVG